MKTRLLFFVILFVLSFTFQSASADNYFWRGTAANGNWNTNGNWFDLDTFSNSGFPVAGDNAFIGVNLIINVFTGSQQPNINSSAACTNLTIGTDETVILTVNSTLSVSGSITVNGSGTINLNTTLTLPAGCTVNNNGTITATNAPIILNANPVTFNNNSNGVVNINSTYASTTSILTINGGCTINNAGAITISATSNKSTIDLTGNPSKINNNSGSTFSVTNDAINVAGGSTITNSGATATITSSPINLSANPSKFVNQNSGGTIGSCTITGNGNAITMGGGSSISNNGGVLSIISAPISMSGASLSNSLNGATVGNFTISSSTVNMASNSTFTNAGTFTVNLASTINLTDNPESITNSSGGNFFLNASTINYQSVGTSLSNAGTFTASNGSFLTTTASSQNQKISNTGTFYAGLSNSACSITLNGTQESITNSGTFYLGSTSIITIAGSGTNSSVSNTGTFTLQSDAFGSASIGPIPSGYGTGPFTGTYNVQRFVQGGSSSYRGYRTMTSPVSSTGANGGLIDLSYIPASTFVTGAVTSPSCTQCVVGGNPSLYLYDEALPLNNSSFVSGNFVGVTDINTTSLKTLSGAPEVAGTATLPAGNGIYLYFRGDKVTNVVNKTNPPFATPENVTFTASGKLNQGNFAIQDWYGSTTLSKVNASPIAQGFHLIGNPYASSIDWDTFTANTAIVSANISSTIYIYNTTTNNYATYIAGGGGIGTNVPVPTTHNANIIPSGEGFFVQAIGAGSSTLTITEAAKVNSQQTTTSNLLLSATTFVLGPPQFLRIQLYKDAANNEDALLFFNNNASPAFVQNEDGPHIKGAGGVTLSTMSSDNVQLAINKLSLLKKSQTIKLNVKPTSDGIYKLNNTEMGNIPNLFDIWLMDAYTKDSLDIKHNPTYSFTISGSDTASISANRFSLVIRQNAAYAYHLLSFAGNKATSGAQLNWTTENEDNYTGFVLERNANNGNGFVALASVPATGAGSYSFLDTNPAAINQYRLKQTDINGTVTYSSIVQIQYSNLSNSQLANNNISIYPNPVKDMMNLNITVSGLTAATYNISITSSTGNMVKTYTSQQTTWQNNTSDLMPGVYFVKVTNNTDKTIVGTSKFIKL